MNFLSLFRNASQITTAQKLTYCNGLMPIGFVYIKLRTEWSDLMLAYMFSRYEFLGHDKRV